VEVNFWERSIFIQDGSLLELPGKNEWGSTLKKRKPQENTLVTIIHSHTFPHKLSSERMVFNGNLTEKIHNKLK